ncbi:MAG: DivIVA domain-containing protein [Ethanoligenens sp.]
MEGMFKTAVSGFKKDEVLAYIDNRETEARQKQEALTQRLRKMTADLNEEKTQHAEAVAQIAQLEAELGRERDRADELAKAAGSVEEEKRAMKAQLNDAHFEVARLRQELSVAKKECEQVKEDRKRIHLRVAELEGAVGELNDKLDHSAKNEDLIGRVLLEAQTTADKILTDAHDEAAKQIADAQEKTAAVLSQSRAEMTELLAQTAQFRSEVVELREGTQRAFSHIDTLLENVEQAAGQIYETYQVPLEETVEDEPPAEEETDDIPAEQAATTEQNSADSTSEPESDTEAQAAGTFDFSRTGN